MNKWKKKRVNLLIVLGKADCWIRKREKGTSLLLSGRSGYCKAYRLCTIVELVGLAAFLLWMVEMAVCMVFGVS